MKTQHVIWGIIGIVALAAAAYGLWDNWTFVTTDNAAVNAHSVLLAPKVAGIIQKVLVDEGQTVKAGQLLVQIDPRDYENSLNTYKGLMQSFEAQRINAERDLRRQKDLLEKNVATQQQFDLSVAALGDVAGRIEAAKAQVAQAALNIENTQLKAPADGFIVRRSAEVGQMASAGVPLIGFVDGTERWVVANLKETELKGVLVGNEAEITVDAIGGKVFHGTVESISAATGSTFTLLPPDNASGNFTKVVQRVPVKIKLQKLEPKDMEALRDGLSVITKVKKTH